MSKSALQAARPDFLSAILQFTYVPSDSIVYFSSHSYANYVRFDGCHCNISFNFLKLYYDQKIISFFSSDFESVFAYNWQNFELCVLSEGCLF